MKLLARNRDLILGLAISLIALSHIPQRYAAAAFDRNAAPQFIVSLGIGFVCAIVILLSKRTLLASVVVRALIALIVTVLISLSLSDSFFSSLIGDTGRYTGVGSFFALIAIALFASTFRQYEFINMLVGAGVGIILVTFLGFLQSFNLLELPTGGGVGSTLGNLDFLSAWTGTTLILAYLLITRSHIPTWVLPIYLAIALITLARIGAKQGFVDVILIVAGIVAFLAARQFRLLRLSTKAWKITAAFLLLLWSEVIYLVTVANLPIPGIHKDANVSIRADFWFSAAQMFFHHIGFGVGPDNYGNYYEKFRSLNSVKVTETVLANDAHSAMMQTLGTLGIFVAISFLVIIFLVIFALIDLYKETKDKMYLLLILAFVVFYTNSLISPITLPNKAIFWAMCGFVLGEWSRRKFNNPLREFFQERVAIRGVGLLAAAVIAFCAYSFIPSFVKVNQALGANNSNKEFTYQVSDRLPCVVYANTQINLAIKSGGQAIKAAEEILSQHPRCLDALAVAVQHYFAKKDFKSAKPYIYQLLDVAPARQSVVRLAAIYATKENDEHLKNLLTSQGFKLGYFTPEDLQK